GTRLTNNAAVDWRPAWSPRGDKIAFVSDRAGNYEIYRMNTDGSNQERLTNSAGDDLDPAWSPNGRQIYFSSQRDGNREIYVMNADGSGQMNLTNNAADDQEPACSPDGSQVAFRTDRDGNTEIYIMQSDGRNAGNFTNHGASDEHPTWAPDAGQYNIGQMALRSTRHGGTDLFIMDLQYQTMVNMTSTGASESDPAWCPAPKVTRTLIGPLGSDGGSDPPLGTSRPLAIVSVRVDGLMSAATVAISAANEGTLDVEPIDNLGAYLAGVKIIGTDITSVREDMGRGLPARVWVVNNSPETNAVLVFLAGDTGKVSSVVAVTDNPVAPVQVEPTGAVVVLRGEFPAVYAAGDFERNLAEGGTREVRLEARTGEVLAIGGAVRSATGKGGAPS
ncbi:MAG: DUF5050 domain-containing protein, partial [Armatimonadetes bacterium]|nr:DUF5050 domain-containing protein [Armatimonadota bacterium]